MIVLIMLSGIVIGTKMCVTDRDCLDGSRTDVHSMFCVDNMCQRILGPGKHCTIPTDCSSYPFFGPLACSGKCGVENECDEMNEENTVYCCRGIPEGKICNPNRPGTLNGCDSGQSCRLGRRGEYECTGDKPYSWIHGVILSVSGNIGINIGINVQKRSYKQMHMRMIGMRLQTFHVGCFIYGLGKILGYCSYVFGNQSLIAALSATGLVSNSIFAPMINDEIFTWKDVCAILFVFGGSTLIVMNARISHKMYGLCELMKMYERKETMLWFGSILSMIVLLFVLIKYVEVNSNWEEPGEMMRMMRNESVWFDEDGMMMKYGMVICYVSVSSLIASFTTLSVKSLGEMIDKTMEGDNQFVFLTTYVFMMMVVMCTILQIQWLNKALRHYDALVVIPLFHVTWTILSIMTAGIYFGEFEEYSINEIGKFVLGMGMIFIGSFIVGLRMTSKTYIDSGMVLVRRMLVDNGSDRTDAMKNQ